MAATPGQPYGPLMLPDLRQSPVGCPGVYSGDPVQCADWDVCMVGDDPALGCVDSGQIKMVRLRFTTAIENIGNGPLLIYGHRDNAAHVTMTTHQAFQIGEHGPMPDSFETAQRGVVEVLYYDTSHEHWHMLSFDQFEMRDLNGKTVVRDQKTGFCLGDRYATAGAASLRHNVRPDGSPERKLAEFLDDNQCKPKDSSATEIKEGLSVGHGDDYAYYVPFQWLDVTHVPSGTYVIVNTVNPSRTLLETDYTNNSSAIAISLQWPGGAHDAPATITKPPVVTLLRSCPGQADCPAVGGS